MKAKNILLVALAVIALGSSGLAWKQYQELLALRAAAVGPQERAELQKRAWDAQRRVNLLQAQLATRRDGMPSAGPDRQKSALGDMASLMFSRMDDPEVRRLMTIPAKAALRRTYAALFRSLNLGPKQIDDLENLLLEKQYVPMDVMMAASQQGINPMQNPDEFKKMVTDGQAEVEAKIQAELGDANYQQLQTYQSTQAQRSVVNQLRSDLSFGDTPLTGTQGDQLVQVLSQTAMPPAPGAAANGPGAGQPQITDATITQAQTILSPPQLDALRDLQQQQQAGAQLQKLMFAQQNGGPPPATAPAKPGG